MDLAGLYEVDTRLLNQAVKRNIGRFPDDLMFQLTLEVTEALRSQIVTLPEVAPRFLSISFAARLRDIVDSCMRESLLLLVVIYNRINNLP